MFGRAGLVYRRTIFGKRLQKEKRSSRWIYDCLKKTKSAVLVVTSAGPNNWPIIIQDRASSTINSSWLK